MNQRAFWMAAALLAAAGQVTAQEPAPRDWGEHAMSPMTYILEHRAELELSDQQVARLEAIGTSLRARTTPLRERMREAMGDLPVPRPRAERGPRGARAPRGDRVAPRPMTPQQREAMRERARELRPVREEIRALRREAREEARAVLTAEQQEKLRDLIRARRGELRRPGGEPRPARRGGRS